MACYQSGLCKRIPMRPWPSCTFFSIRLTVVKSATSAIEMSSIYPTSCGWLTLVKPVGCIGQVAPQSPHPSGSCHTSATRARSTCLHSAACCGRCAQACGFRMQREAGLTTIKRFWRQCPVASARSQPISSNASSFFITEPAPAPYSLRMQEFMLFATSKIKATRLSSSTALHDQAAAKATARIRVKTTSVAQQSCR